MKVYEYYTGTVVNSSCMSSKNTTLFSITRYRRDDTILHIICTF